MASSMKSITPMYKFLGALCFLATIIIICYTEISQIMMTSTDISASFHNYFLSNTVNTCNLTSCTNPSLINVTYIYSLLNTTLISIKPSGAASCNCTPTVIVTKQEPEFTQWHAQKQWHSANTFPLCTMDTCFDFSRCDRTGFSIYAYPPPYNLTWYIKELPSSRWYTEDPNKACLFLINLPQIPNKIRRPPPQTLPYWNSGMNHVFVSLSDRWTLTGPPPESIGNASILSSCLHETTYRPGFDIPIPLPAKVRLTYLQNLKPWERKYFLTFKGTRYLGPREGNFRSDPALKEMHNGKDVIIAVTCNQYSNNLIRQEHPEEGVGCDDDQIRYKQYNFKDIMNSTFALAPAGRSPSSYRLIEILSAGSIPVLICDNYVKPFDTIIQWHQCLLQFPTSEMRRILPVLRSISREEMEMRQRYCRFFYENYLKDDKALFESVVKSLKLRFYGMMTNFHETLPLANATIP